MNIRILFLYFKITVGDALYNKMHNELVYCFEFKLFSTLANLKMNDKKRLWYYTQIEMYRGKDTNYCLNE
jgi:hypothetical protein